MNAKTAADKNGSLGAGSEKQTQHQATGSVSLATKGLGEGSGWGGGGGGRGGMRGSPCRVRVCLPPQTMHSELHADEVFILRWMSGKKRKVAMVPQMVPVKNVHRPGDPRVSQTRGAAVTARHALECM